MTGLNGFTTASHPDAASFLRQLVSKERNKVWGESGEWQVVRQQC